MFNIHTVSLEWAGRTLTLETGRMARQADAAVLATYGDTQVLATFVAARTQKEGVDFFPLTVNYQEKFYAAGRIPGGYFKREGRPTERETLISRLIDRPMRPLFVEGFRNETQIIVNTLSYDLENDPDVVALIAASAAATLSGAPFLGPIAGARVGLIDGELVLNPAVADMARSELDLIIAGTVDAVMMVESEAKELSEARMLAAVMHGHRGMQPVIEAIIRLAEKAAGEPWDFTPPDNSGVIAAIRSEVGGALKAAYQIVTKQERHAAVDAARSTAKEKLLKSEANPQGYDALRFKEAFKALEAETVRGSILETGMRIDGRKTDQVRSIRSETGILPRTHGSSLFTRGETQALCIATLGTGEDEQYIDSLEGTHKERFMLHYNFPPFSVGETGRMGGPGRREIGHGKLAWRALQAVLPSREEFPYTIRVVSEILESNGSSSMATVCGSSLALMDAGVPIKRPVSGIAMGLILEPTGFAVLSDILGDEDHLGDMDFKVAGTEKGVTSLQMDIKIAGITEEIMHKALAQAEGGRRHILAEMNKALGTSRGQVAATAPKMVAFTIPTDKIREVIGSGGKVIREIVEKTGAKIDIEDDGSIRISAVAQESIDAAVKWVKSIATEPEIGQIYEGKVVKIMEFGAFVNFFGNKDGLVHVSQLAAQKVRQVSDVVKEGDMVKVKLLGVDDRGKVRLSMRVVDQMTGEDIEARLKQAEGAE